MAWWLVFDVWSIHEDPGPGLRWRAEDIEGGSIVEADTEGEAIERYWTDVRGDRLEDLEGTEHFAIVPASSVSIHKAKVEVATEVVIHRKVEITRDGQERVIGERRVEKEMLADGSEPEIIRLGTIV